MPPSIALIRLILAGGRLAPRRRLLDAHSGDAAAALEAGISAWRASGLSEAQCAALRKPDAGTLSMAASAAAWLDAPAHHLITWGDVDYPVLLSRIASPPLALFVDGEPGHLWHPQVAVVGSRDASPNGRDTAHQFAHALAVAGLAITSGLAAGIDAAAHAAALDHPGGLTVAVLGCGPDVAYPAAHRELRDRIAARGAVVSEYLPGTPPLRVHFPARNRLIAGLAAGMLVVEAAERSGALISARIAAESGREVFAVPGSIHHPLARGCHALIRDGAALATHPDDIIASLAPALADTASALRNRLDGALPALPDTPTEMPDDPYGLWKAMGHDPTSMEQLVDRTGLTVARLSPILLTLELEGRVSVQHGRYTRKSPVLR